jgi:hypothetical protein
LLGCAAYRFEAGGGSAEAEKNLFGRCIIFVLVVLYAAMPAIARPTGLSDELFYGSEPVLINKTEQYSPDYYLASVCPLKDRIKYSQAEDNAVSDSESVSAMALPATPASGLITLVGFICVSFIRDRRIWLAGFAGLLPSVEKANYAAVSPASDSKIQSEINTIAGYAKREISANNAGIFNISRNNNSCVNVVNRKYRSAAYDKLNTSYSAVLNKVLCPDSNGLCLVSGTRQFVCFEPALIFCRIPRGPPISQMRPFYKSLVGV